MPESWCLIDKLYADIGQPELVDSIQVNYKRPLLLWRRFASVTSREYAPT